MEEVLTMNQVSASMILMGALTYVGYQLKAVPKYIWDWFLRKTTYRVTIEETDELFLYIERWLVSNHNEKYKNVEATLKTKYSQDRNSNGYYPDIVESSSSKGKEEKDSIKYWQFDDLFILKHKGKRLTINKGREKMEAAKYLRSAFLNRFTISGIFAKKHISKLLDEIVEYNQQFKEQEPLRVYISDGTGYWERGGEVNSKTMEGVFLNQKELLMSDLDKYTKSEHWYKLRSIPYKRGYLFHGAPGNGKTATCLAMADYLDRDIYFLSLNDVDGDKYLSRQFTNLPPRSILVLEDVDAAFSERKSKKTAISLSALLNCLDGALSRHDIITIMTTNHPEKLDPALIRAGRADIHLEITNPNKEMVEDYLQLFYEDKSIKLTDFTKDTIAMVDVQNICLRNKDSHVKALKEIKAKSLVENLELTK